jgi:hypothetical protein
VKIDYSTLLSALVLSTSGLGVHATAEEDASEYTILPGLGIGPVKLGMNRIQITETMGKRDGKYSLPSGIKVEYAEWKDPNKTSTIRVFFSPSGKAVQFAFEADKPCTADGITTNSSLEEVTKKYPAVKRVKYRAKASYIDYYDDIKKGIAFEFAGAAVGGECKKQLYAILVHLPGKRVIPEFDEKPIHESH